MPRCLAWSLLALATAALLATYAVSPLAYCWLFALAASAAVLALAAFAAGLLLSDGTVLGIFLTRDLASAAIETIAVIFAVLTDIRE